MKLITIPFGAGGLGRTVGTEYAPEAILTELKAISLNEQGVKPEFKQEAVAVDQANISGTNQAIVEHLLQNDEMPVILGGDHSISYACFTAVARKFQRPGLVVFDAHPDCEHDFSPPTHEDFVRVLISEGVVKPEQVILVGLRSWHQNEHEFISRNKIKHFTMREIALEGLSEVADALMSAALPWGATYVSVDIDVLDPAFAPGTGYPEAGGLTTRELLYFIQRLARLRNVRAFDLVEINPSLDRTGLTVKAGAKLVAELFQRTLP